MVYFCARPWSRLRLRLFAYHLSTSVRPLHTSALVKSVASSSHNTVPVGTDRMSKLIDKYRLPVNIKPVHYDLTIRTDLEELIYDGFVKIQSVLDFIFS
jgi:hypothetical protein